MNYKAGSIFCAAFFLLLLSIAGAAQVTSSNPNGKPVSLKDLKPGERALVDSSKASIIKTGITAPYFNRKFKLDRVFDLPADRRVVWKFTVDEYEAFVNDAVGFNTDDKGKRIYLHSIGSVLGRARDIATVIPRKRARELLKQCLGGDYTSESVVFQPHGTPLRAMLLLTGLSIPTPIPETEEEKRQRLERERNQTVDPDRDKIREGGRKNPVMYIGYVDLETGNCTKALARSGAPKPL